MHLASSNMQSFALWIVTSGALDLYIYIKKQGLAHENVQIIALCTLNIEGTKLVFAYFMYAKNALKYTRIVWVQWLPIASWMFKCAIEFTLWYALHVTTCKSLNFALLFLQILLDYLMNCLTHEPCMLKCARLCTVGQVLHIQVWKIFHFLVFVAPREKHGLAHANVQVIVLCTLNIDGTKLLFKCAKFSTLW